MIDISSALLGQLEKSLAGVLTGSEERNTTCPEASSNGIPGVVGQFVGCGPLFGKSSDPPPRALAKDAGVNACTFITISLSRASESAAMRRSPRRPADVGKRGAPRPESCEFQESICAAGVAVSRCRLSAGLKLIKP